MDARRAEINPSFDECPVRCSHDGKSRNDFCRECEVRPLWEEFEQGAREDLDDYFKEQTDEAGREWSFESLLADVRRLQRIDAELDGKGYPEGASELQAQALNTVRAARDKLRRSEEWDTWRKRKDQER